MVEAETQTDRLITTPLEVLAVSCITYKMIDSIRTAVNQAEHDLATLLFRNSIPESVLGESSADVCPLPAQEEEEEEGGGTRKREEPGPTLPLDFRIPSHDDNSQDQNKDNVEDHIVKLGSVLKSMDSEGVTISDQNNENLFKRRKVALTRIRKNSQNKELENISSSRKTGAPIKEEQEEVADCSTKRGVLYNCSQCRAEFQCADRLARHISMVHANVRSSSEPGVCNSNIPCPANQCVACNQTFNNSALLREHQLKHHRTPLVKNNGIGNICQICGRWLSDAASLNEHKIKHTATKKFRCHVCYKGFSKENNLMHHLYVIHKEEKALGIS